MRRILELIQGRNLIFEGTLAQSQQGLITCLNFNGTTNYGHARAREYRGLTGFTFGGWFQSGAAAGTFGSVWQAAANQIWRLYITGTKPTFGVSGTGANEILVQFPVAISLNTWYFLAARYTPSAEVALWVNNAKTVNITSVPASLFSTILTDYCVGSTHSGGNLLTGKASMVFFCSSAVPDVYLNNLYNMGRAMYS